MTVECWLRMQNDRTLLFELSSPDRYDFDYLTGEAVRAILAGLGVPETRLDGVKEWTVVRSLSSLMAFDQDHEDLLGRWDFAWTLTVSLAADVDVADFDSFDWPPIEIEIADMVERSFTGEEFARDVRCISLYIFGTHMFDMPARLALDEDVFSDLPAGISVDELTPIAIRGVLGYRIRISYSSYPSDVLFVEDRILGPLRDRGWLTSFRDVRKLFR